ncbi:hypothetical protein B5V01_32060 [Mesorhizobium erdmanii]|uniref:Uncharacterized protein n=1 Tax=Mesorhizobium erdmanii TaxID=1777866 RepID=A0A4Q1UMC5_9HYPH|nr:hypothetical protein B5V01_32060 [Mesorhizobium erdmanii]
MGQSGCRVPLTTFLIRAYMLDLPGDLDQAETIDGAGEGRIFWRITIVASATQRSAAPRIGSSQDDTGLRVGYFADMLTF